MVTNTTTNPINTYDCNSHHHINLHNESLIHSHLHHVAIIAAGILCVQWYHHVRHPFAFIVCCVLVLTIKKKMKYTMVDRDTKLQCTQSIVWYSCYQLYELEYASYTEITPQTLIRIKTYGMTACQKLLILWTSQYFLP